jgi:exopolysaccharide biosynthesis polyprenyl glycosylphosphotransferase
MLRRKQEFNLQFQQIVDGLLLAIAFWTAHVLRSYGTVWFHWVGISAFNDFRWMLFVTVPFGPLILEMQGFYGHPLQQRFWKSLGQMLRAAFWLCVLYFGCWIFLHLEVPSRAVLLLFGLIAALLLSTREWIVAIYYKRRARSGAVRESVLLAGLAADIEQIKKTFTPVQLMEIDIVAEIDIENQPIADLIHALHEHSVSRVILAGGHTHLNRIQEAIGACEVEGVEAWLVADFIKTSIARPDFDMMGARPMLVFRTTPEISWALMVKSVIDRVGAAVLILLAAPFFVGAAIGIRITSPGPVVFRQKRAGKHGRPFTMFKFRTMQTDAEMRQAELIAYNQMTGPVFKIERDPRITRFGRWLRQWSIDELPQLVNVLQGHMSLVGPRPLPIYEVEKFEDTAQRRRLSVKPGLTCLWQVSGRNEVKDFREWVRLDLKYIDNWSIWLDFKILLKTIPAVLSGFGAK